MHAADLHGLAHRRPATEELLAYPSTKKHHAAALQFVSRGNPAPFRRDLIAHLAILRANAADRGRAHDPFAIADPGAIHGLQSNVFHQGSSFLDDVEVSLFQPYLFAGTLPAGLLAGLLRPADNHALAESVKPAYQDAAKAAAIGDQKSDGGNSPDNAQHGQQAAGVVAPEGGPGFENDFSQHASNHPRPCRDGSPTRPGRAQLGRP